METQIRLAYQIFGKLLNVNVRCIVDLHVRETVILLDEGRVVGDMLANIRVQFSITRRTGGNVHGSFRILVRLSETAIVHLVLVNGPNSLQKHG